jgi:hypothetical protein
VGLAFPDPCDIDYDFEPRLPDPKPPVGPVTSDEFCHHYYHNDDPSCFTWRRYQRKQRWNNRPRESIDSVPKRKVRLNMDDPTPLLFYGLCAKERRSFAHVAVYICLCNTPALIFFFLWLFHWGHGSDLQNAAVPFSLSAMLSLSFAALVYSTAGDEKESG